MKPIKKRVTAQVSVRLGAELDERFQNACKKTGIDSSTIVRASLEAFCEEVETKGGIWLPLKIVPKTDPKKPASIDPAIRASGSFSRSTHARTSHRAGDVDVIAEDSSGVHHFSLKSSKK